VGQELGWMVGLTANVLRESLGILTEVLTAAVDWTSVAASSNLELLLGSVREMRLDPVSSELVGVPHFLLAESAAVRELRGWASLALGL